MPMMKGKAGAKSLFGPFCINYGTFASNLSFGAKPTRSMVHGKNRNPYWIDRRLNDLAGPEYHAIISFGLPIEPEDSQYGESRSIALVCLISTTRAR